MVAVDDHSSEYILQSALMHKAPVAAVLDVINDPAPSAADKMYFVDPLRAVATAAVAQLYSTKSCGLRTLAIAHRKILRALK